MAVSRLLQHSGRMVTHVSEKHGGDTLLNLRGQMQRGVKGETILIPVEEPGHENQVA